MYAKKWVCHRVLFRALVSRCNIKEKVTSPLASTPSPLVTISHQSVWTLSLLPRWRHFERPLSVWDSVAPNVHEKYVINYWWYQVTKSKLYWPLFASNHTSVCDILVCLCLIVCVEWIEYWILCVCVSESVWVCICVCLCMCRDFFGLVNNFGSPITFSIDIIINTWASFCHVTGRGRPFINSSFRLTIHFP